MLNTCAHRGNAVCRAEEGNAKSFLCTYHGWSYGIDGRLNGVPGLNTFYNGGLDKALHGLAQIAQVANYKGFIFASHDASAPPLEEFLGATGRLGLDSIAVRGDMEVVPGIQKFVIECNWKIAVDNLFDWYHPQITHASVFQPGVLPTGPRSEARFEKIDMNGANMQSGAGLELPEAGISGAKFETVVVLGEYGHAIAGPNTSSSGYFEFSPEWRDTPQAKAALGPIGIKVAGHPNIFPSTWVTVTQPQISLRIPRDPGHTEIWWFTLIDRNMPREMRDFMVSISNRIFGPAGLLEQEDGENWAQATTQSRGAASRRIKHLIKMGVGRGKIIKEGGLSRIEGLTSEHAQLWMYYSWAQWLKALSWDELKKATTPGDYI
jgi:3-phenylpropionate/trans-cinnamate dioxygenase alpha subunit